MVWVWLAWSSRFNKILSNDREGVSFNVRSKRWLFGSGDRSERIRTYNFPQGRVTDHRINLTLYKLDQLIQGDLSEMVSALIEYDQAEKLAEINE